MPGAVSYKIAAFEVNGTPLLHLAGWKKHVSLYPVSRAMLRAGGDALKPHLTGKATLQLPLGRALPVELIRRVVEARVAEVESGSAG